MFTIGRRGIGAGEADKSRGELGEDSSMRGVSLHQSFRGLSGGDERNLGTRMGVSLAFREAAGSPRGLFDRDLLHVARSSDITANNRHIARRESASNRPQAANWAHTIGSEARA